MRKIFAKDAHYEDEWEHKASVRQYIAMWSKDKSIKDITEYTDFYMIDYSGPMEVSTREGT